mmetsp:Transcript_44483/g.108661  ORF Transcript_44483/g.108661 Transcript_44483/m.108661 type:complete len:448 (-) Transcript_44483:142-1485(-)
MLAGGPPARVLAAAMSYRAFLVALSLASHAVLGDYDSSTRLLYPAESPGGVCGLARGAAMAFDKWDSVHMMRAADEGYVNEHQHAFYPLLPLAARAMRPALSLIMPGCDERSLLVLAACALSHASAVLALWPMHRLSCTHLPTEKAAEVATLLFALQPSSPFTLVPYTEALFSLLALSSQVQVEKGNVLQAALLMALASGLRSNGVLLPVFFLLPLLLQFLRPSAARPTLPKALLIIVALAFSVLPHVVFTLYGAGLYCFPAQLQRFLALAGAGQGWQALGRAAQGGGGRPWCNSGWASPLSNIYSYVQGHYWGVGFLRYYQPEQVPNFLLAAPAILSSLAGCTQFLRARSDGKSSEYLGAGALSYVLHCGFLTIFALLCINVQVSTRLLSSCPATYWFAARVLLEGVDLRAEGSRQVSVGAQCLVAYHVGYSCVGTVLFSTFLPWT